MPPTFLLLQGSPRPASATALMLRSPLGCFLLFGVWETNTIWFQREEPLRREKPTVCSLSTFFRDGERPKQQIYLEFSLRRLTQVRCSFHSPMLWVDQHSKSCLAQLIRPSISWSLSLGPPQLPCSLPGLSQHLWCQEE